MTAPLRLNRRHLLALTAAAGLGGVLSAWAQPQRLRMKIGQIGGSANDMVDRALAKTMQEARPGLVIEVENATGASGRVIFRDLLKSPGDSGLLGMIQNGLLYSVLSDEAQLLEDFRSLTLLGGLGNDDRVLFVAKRTGIETFEQLQAQSEPLVMAAINATSTGTIDALIVNTLTGTRIRPVPGFGSNAERRLAMLNGEANVVVGSTAGQAPNVEAGEITPLLRINRAAPGALYPGLPELTDVATGRDAAQLCALVDTMALTQQFLLAPPGIAAADADWLSALLEAAADGLKTVPPIGFEPNDADFAPRQEVEERLRGLIGSGGLRDALRRATECGRVLGDGGRCS